MLTEDTTLPLHPEVWVGPKPDLLLLTFEEYFSHSAEQTHVVLVGKRGCAHQLRRGCNQCTHARAAVGTSTSFLRGKGAMLAAPTQPTALLRHWEQPRASRAGDSRCPGSSWFTGSSYTSRVMAKCEATWNSSGPAVPTWTCWNRSPS